MKPRTKKIVKYSIMGAIFATLILLFLRVWKRIRNGVAAAKGSMKEGTIVMTPNKEGNYEKSLIRKSGELKRALDASAGELNLWADNIKEFNKSDWFTRLITLNFKRKK